MTSPSVIHIRETPTFSASVWAAAVQVMKGVDWGMATARFQQPDLVFLGASHGIIFEAKSSGVGAAWRAQNIIESWASELEGLRDRASDTADELKLLLLRTAEEAISVPCSTSGLLHGLERATPPLLDLTGMPDLLRVLDGQHRVAPIRQMYEALVSRAFPEEPTPQDVVRGRSALTVGELAQVVNDAEALASSLRALTQSFLLGAVQHMRYLVAVPPHESSPCGVLRLASPIVPGAPGQGLAIVPIDLALAA